MIITIDLPSEVESKIKTQASNNGLKVEEYIKSLIEEETERRELKRGNSEETFDEILAPIRKGFEESGMSEEELLEFFEEVREEVWQEKQKQNEGK